MTEWFGPFGWFSSSDESNAGNRSRNPCNQFENEDAAMSLGKEMKMCATSGSLLLGLFMSASTLAMAQSEPAPPPPPGPGMILSMHGPGGGALFHEDIGEGPKVVTG